MEEFKIEDQNAYSAMFYLLLRIAARQRALEETILNYLADKSGESFDSISLNFDKTTAFHRQKVYEELYAHFASLKDLFGEEPESTD